MTRKIAGKKLTGVHHVTYMARDLDAIADYLEKHFNVPKQDGKLIEGYEPGEDSAILVYHIGDAIVDFIRIPPHDKTTVPGLLHVGYGVEGIEGWIEDLTADGLILTGAMGVGGNLPLPSPVGYKAVNISASSPGADGVFMHLAEGKSGQWPVRHGKSPEQP